MPLYKKEFLTGGGGWAVWNITETNKELVNMLPVGGCYQKEIEAFKASSARIRERLAIRVLMYYCWGNEHEVAYCDSGKPFLVDGSFFISVSHTNGYASICWSPFKKVSIDIEFIRPKALRLQERFVHPDEHVGGDKIYGAILLWSMKETLFKILENQDAVSFLHHLFIYPFMIQSEGYAFGTDRRNPAIVYKLNYRIDRDFVLTYIE